MGKILLFWPIFIAYLILGSALKENKMPDSGIMGQIIVYEDFPSNHVQSRNVEVWLPPSFGDEPKQQYPVIYMHDGQNVFNPKTSTHQIDWDVDGAITRLTEESRIREAIVVAIWSTPNRIAEYMPQKAFEALSEEQIAALPNYHGNFPRSDGYLKFLVEELKPFIDNKYPTLTDLQNTAIMGASMGGLISLYAICEYPEVFGYAGCLSTHFPIANGIVLEYMKENLPDPENHKIYFDYGTETLDAQYEPYQLKADAIMQENGWERNKNWMTKKFEGHDHSEMAWRSRVHVPLEFFFGRW